MLNPEQITGRTRTHVREFPALECALQPDAAAAFIALRAAAAGPGLDLVAASGFRDFERQRTLWNDKFHGRRALLDADGRPLDPSKMAPEQIVRAILHWSALPGASRHHWGCDVDIVDRAALAPGQRPQLIPAEYARGGVFGPLAAWLDAQAAEYGFFRPYDCDRGGVQPEPWHWSFAPVAAAALEGLTVGVLAAALEGAELSGWEAVGPQLPRIHERYVRAVAAPGALALAAPRARLNPAARPS
jgi:LAS superfamily LD-carboxypeptidase LdcB